MICVGEWVVFEKNEFKRSKFCWILLFEYVGVKSKVEGRLFYLDGFLV